MWITVSMDGHCYAYMRDGSVVHLFKLALESYTFDWSYHEPRGEHSMWVADTEVGKILQVQRQTGAQSVWAEGFVRITSLREVNGELFVVDEPKHEVWRIDIKTKQRTCISRGAMRQPFWIDYQSDGTLVVGGRDRNIYRMTRDGTLIAPSLDAGSADYSMTPVSKRTSGGQEWVQLSVDRNGTWGLRDAITFVSVTGSTNTDFYRFDREGRWLKPIDHSFNVFGAGELVHVRDGIPGHYPWTVAHHPDEGLLLCHSRTQADPFVIAARQPSDGWQPGGMSFEEADPAFQDIERGYSKSAPQAVPSLTAMINCTGGGQLWTPDHVSQMSAADAMAWVRNGCGGSFSRNFTPVEVRRMVLYLCRHSQRYLRDGKPYMDQLRAELTATP